MSDEVERFTGGRAVGVDVGAIERDLAALWRKASSDGSGDSVMRACSWNLVVHATTPVDLERAKLLAEALVASVPSRTLVLARRGDVGPDVEASVTANCRRLPGGGRVLCTEEITIEARPAGGDYLPSLLRALLVPDTPTAVLWASVPPRTPLVDELATVADRLIVDTAQTGPEGLSRVAGLGPKALRKVADLAWLRTAPRRRVTAGAFDPPVDASLLYRLRRVSITCAPDAVAPARLMLGWLAARLGWGSPEALEDAERPGWVASRQGGRVLLDLLPTSTAPGIERLSFESERGERVQVASTSAGVTVEGAGAAHTVPHLTLADEALVTAALGPRGSDRLYHAALQRAVEFEAAS